MIKVKIPKDTPLLGDLKVTIKIGKQGFKRTEVYKASEWAPNMEIYVDQDTTSVVFTKLGVAHWSETLYINPF